MTRPLPAEPLLALLRAFDPDNPDPAATMNAAAAALEGLMYAESIADLNEGQYAAVLDRLIDMGADAFAATRLARLVNNGNLTLPVYEFKLYGKRGLAELDVWLTGNPN
jgi:GH24 family phage-related lysozyme (muramidase)